MTMTDDHKRKSSVRKSKMESSLTGPTQTYKDVMWLKRMFDAIDVNHDDAISKPEFIAAMKNNKELEGLTFSVLDKNHDGDISFKEYVKAFFPHATKKEIEEMLSYVKPTDMQILEEQKKRADAEQARLDREHREDLDDARSTFEIFDTNGDGLLEMSEFLKMGYELVEAENLMAAYGQTYKVDHPDEQGNKVLAETEALNLSQWLNLYMREYLGIAEVD